MRHAFQAGDAVVDRDEQLRPLRERQVDDGRREAVAMHLAVGHHVAQRVGARAQQRQAAQRDGAGGGTVAVVVGHDDDALALRDGVGEQPGRVGGAFEFGRGDQLGQRIVELLRRGDAACGVQPREQRVDAGLFERPGGAGRYVAGGDAHAGSRVVIVRGVRGVRGVRAGQRSVRQGRRVFALAGSPSPAGGRGSNTVRCGGCGCDPGRFFPREGEAG